ncbi:MAG: nitroreductase family protein [Vicinamibacterales bacterium]
MIRERWSPRAFDPAADISDAELHRLFEAARWAPSSLNEQPWRFLVARRARSGAAFAALLHALTLRNQEWARAAPLLVLVVVRSTLERTGQVNTHAWYDAGQAVAFLTLQATAGGLASRQMQGFDPARAREACRVPEPFEPAVVLALGRVGDPAALATDAHRAAELQPRQRRPIADFVFDEEWGRPLAR